MAGKLITPVQHEPVLDGLNEIRPLQLRDDVQRVIGLPALNANPVNNPNNVRGKFLRCSQQGAILGTQNRYYDNYEEIMRERATAYEAFVITFSQIVKFVQVEIRSMSEDGYLRWRTLSPIYVIKDYSAVGFYYWPVRGTQLSIRISGSGVGTTRVYFRGFY